MFTVDDIRKEMKRLDGISGIDTSHIPVRISKRMTRAWGTCHVKGIRGGKLNVTELTFADRLCRYGKLESLLDTVRHEYAHAYVTLKYNKLEHHGPLWQAAAVRFGTEPSRFGSYPEVNEAMKREKGGKTSVPAPEVRLPKPSMPKVRPPHTPTLPTVPKKGTGSGSVRTQGTLTVSGYTRTRSSDGRVSERQLTTQEILDWLGKMKV